jgi:hypothetical protein
MCLFSEFPANKGPCEGNDYKNAAFLFLCEAAAVGEEHLCPFFALVNPFEDYLQVPELLVLRFPHEKALDVGVKVVLVDVHFIEMVCILEYLLVSVIGAFAHQLQNNLILQPA